jgi:hypothetical protein
MPLLQAKAIAKRGVTAIRSLEGKTMTKNDFRYWVLMRWKTTPTDGTWWQLTAYVWVD